MFEPLSFVDVWNPNTGGVLFSLSKSAIIYYYFAHTMKTIAVLLDSDLSRSLSILAGVQ